MESPAGMIQRWLDTLTNFNFEVEHRAGTQHLNADSLSRAEHASPPDNEVDISMGEMAAASLSSVQEDPIWTPDFIHQQQQTDEDLLFILKWVQLGIKPDHAAIAAASRIGKIYAGLFCSLRLDYNHLLRYQLRIGAMELDEERDVLLLPWTLWVPAIHKAHEASAHMAADTTVK